MTEENYHIVCPKLDHEPLLRNRSMDGDVVEVCRAIITGFSSEMGDFFYAPRAGVVSRNYEYPNIEYLNFKVDFLAKRKERIERGSRYPNQWNAFHPMQILSMASKELNRIEVFFPKSVTWPLQDILHLPPKCSLDLYLLTRKESTSPCHIDSKYHKMQVRSPVDVVRALHPVPVYQSPYNRVTCSELPIYKNVIFDPHYRPRNI